MALELLLGDGLLHAPLQDGGGPRAVAEPRLLAPQEVFGEPPVEGQAQVPLLGRVYGPDGLRVSRKTNAGSTCDLDPTAPERRRALYDDTFLDDFEAASLDEELLEACS